ncbi:hypothetical protein BvCmsNSNP043_03972 [Escherichia coli]|nr:hypothetical protein BvCmsNSNP043_03972 [Escherichia coli]
MYPVLGTMLPEICEAPHLPVFSFIHHSAPHLIGWDVFITFFERSSYHTGGHPFGIQREDLVIYPSNTGLIFLYQLWFEGTVTIARSTHLQWTVACDNSLCGITVAGVSSRSGLIFLISRGSAPISSKSLTLSIKTIIYHVVNRHIRTQYLRYHLVGLLPPKD